MYEIYKNNALNIFINVVHGAVVSNLSSFVIIIIIIVIFSSVPLVDIRAAFGSMRQVANIEVLYVVSL